MKKIFLVLIAYLFCIGWTWTGGWDTDLPAGVEFYTVATLPSSPSENDLAGVTDGNTASDCTVGGGTNQNICVYDGAAWTIIGDGGGGTVEDGTAKGQLNFWDGSSEWVHTETTELFWDDTNKRVGIGTSAPTQNVHIYEDDAGIVRLRLENPHAGAASVVGTTFQVVGDTGYGSIGYTNSGSTLLGGKFANTFHIFNQGYGDTMFTIDGNKAHVWYTDPTDSHDYSSLSNEVMRIDADGTVGIGTSAPSGVLDTEGGDVFIGTGTLTNASADDDLSVEGNLEVDGVIYGDGSGLTGVAKAYNEIGDPDGDGTIAFTDYTNAWTSTETGSDFFTIDNSGAFGDVSLMKISTSGNPTDGTMFEIVNTDGDVDSIIAPNFTLTQAGNLTATQAVLGGSLTLSDGVVTDNDSDITFTSTSDGFVFVMTDGGVGDDFIVDGTTFVVESDNNRVGIGTSVPSGILDVEGGDVFIGTGTLTNASADDDLSVEGNIEFDGKIYGDGSELTGIAGGGGKYNEIEDPDGDGTIAFTDYTNAWTSTETGSDFFTIDNSGAFGDISIMKISTSGAPTDGTMLEIVNTDTDVDSIIAPGFSLAQDSTMTVANDAWVRATDYAGTGVVNMFKDTVSDTIEVGATLSVGDTISIVEDAGTVRLVNQNVSASAADGTEESYTFAVDNTDILKVYALSDGTGGIDTHKVIVDNGVFGMVEVSATPDSITGYAAVYPKTDDMAYWQDGAGTEHKLCYCEENYAGMYFYESAGTETIGQTNQYYAIQGEFSSEDVDNWTFVAGSSGSGNITTAAAGAATNIADVAHGLVSGDYVNVQSANHDGTSVVTYVDDDNFTVAIAYVGDEACTWQEGDYLLAGTGSDGHYLLNYSITGNAGAASKSFKFEPVQNATHVDKAAVSITTSGTDPQSASGTTIINVTVSDRIWLQFKNITDTQDWGYEHANMTLIKI